jgi:multidrug efflux pump subunit AcrA (membrane-fusion protein)
MMTRLAAPTIPTRNEPVKLLPHRKRDRLQVRRFLPVLVIVMIVAVGAVAISQTARTAPVLPADSARAQQLQRYPARGQVRPVAQARVGTQGGGVVQELYVEPGHPVQEYQELARVLNSGGVEIVRAPFAGTVTNVVARRGDTVLPGATLLNVGDLGRLQVETTDLDEFVIADVSRGQIVYVLVDALGYELLGRVRSAALEPTRSELGDDHYPVIIDLLETAPNLRPGMNARIRFAPPVSQEGEG